MRVLILLHAYHELSNSGLGFVWFAENFLFLPCGVLVAV
ncbi:Uncharacterised protein [Chlamydia trachomatis]|nr:Uncharacterised protein [Chlamydia trachomatis]